MSPPTIVCQGGDERAEQAGSGAERAGAGRGAARSGLERAGEQAPSITTGPDKNGQPRRTEVTYTLGYTQWSTLGHTTPGQQPHLCQYAPGLFCRLIGSLLYQLSQRNLLRPVILITFRQVRTHLGSSLSREGFTVEKKHQVPNSRPGAFQRIIARTALGSRTADPRLQS